MVEYTVSGYGEPTSQLGTVAMSEARRPSLHSCVEAAVEAGVDLSGVDLSGANLFRANLVGANLSGANLSGANLSRARLSYANLSGADLSRANLSYTNLSRADLFGANLSNTNLSGVDLSRTKLDGADLSRTKLDGADLSRTKLDGADLSCANLQPIMDDLFAVLATARDEAPAFLAALRAGRIDGSVYEGDCRCLVGTIAAARGVDVHTLLRNSTRPIERFLLAVRVGDTPKTNQVAKLVANWTEDFIKGAA